MPTTYAHYKFGLQVAERLPEDIRSIIEEYPELFYIGVHGPDILFYYNPLKSNDVVKLGNVIHAEPGLNFFTDSIKPMKKSKLNDKDLAYMYGFLCHYALDRACHGFIDDEVERTGISHTEIEAELDALMLTRDGFDATKRKVTGHIHPSKSNARVISKYFKGVSAFQVDVALRTWVVALDFMVTTCKAKRFAINTAFKLSGQYDFMHGLLMNLKPNKKCRPTVDRILELYDTAIPEAVEFIEDYIPVVQGEKDFSSLFDYSFDGRPSEK